MPSPWFHPLLLGRALQQQQFLHLPGHRVQRVEVQRVEMEGLALLFLLLVSRVWWWLVPERGLAARVAASLRPGWGAPPALSAAAAPSSSPSSSSATRLDVQEARRVDEGLARVHSVLRGGGELLKSTW